MTIDGAGTCKCGTDDSCSGPTPKCDSGSCVGCDSNTFCTALSTALPFCVLTGQGKGRCQCGDSKTCGQGDNPTGNLCSADDATGVCMCGNEIECNEKSRALLMMM